eukprot:c19166_g1_i2.p1 GENE.c19166_g1_i2~~c19166_g1_i2.p1  ORF type:complete len:182 (+),score=28.74 c19166_g1_i2:149-694(+)
MRRCEMAVTEKELQIRLPENSKPSVAFTNVPETLPMICRGAQNRLSTNVLGITVTPLSAIFAVDVSHLSFDLRASWYGPCIPRIVDSTPICSRTISDGYPLDLQVNTSNLMVYPGNVAQSYYMEVRCAELMAPLSMASFFTASEVSPIVHALVRNASSRVAVRTTFLGNAHTQGFWYHAQP